MSTQRQNGKLLHTVYGFSIVLLLAFYNFFFNHLHWTLYCNAPHTYFDTICTLIQTSEYNHTSAHAHTSLRLKDFYFILYFTSQKMFNPKVLQQLSHLIYINFTMLLDLTPGSWASMYQTTRPHTPEDHNTDHCENLKSHFTLIMYSNYFFKI
jgi:nicotinamide riboside transporter PnuC